MIYVSLFLVHAALDSARTGRYGSSGAKTLSQLLKELRTGESTLAVSATALLRVTEPVRPLRLHREG